MEWRGRRNLLCLLAALLLLAACTRSPSAEGFRTVELVHRVSGRQEKETVWYGADAVRLSRPGETYILRYADRTVFALDDAKKAYRETSLESLLGEGKERLPDLPDLVRSFGGGADLDIEETPQWNEYGGIRGRLTRITAEKVNVELFLSDSVQLPGPRRPTFEFLQALGGPLAPPAVLFEHVSGFPIRSIIRVQGGPWEVKVARSLLSFEPVEPKASDFEVPPDYQKIA